MFCHTSVPGGTILVSYSWTRRTADILEVSAIPEGDIKGTRDSKGGLGSSPGVLEWLAARFQGIPSGAAGITNSPRMWLEGPGYLVFYTRWNMEVLEALYVQGRWVQMWSKTITAARGDDSSHTAARGVDS